MTSILNFIKEHIFETIIIGLLVVLVLFRPSDSGDTERSIQQIRDELASIDESLGAGLERLQNVEDGLSNGIQQTVDLREYITEENKRTRDYLDANLRRTQDSADRLIERELIIDESQRILERLRSGNYESRETK